MKKVSFRIYAIYKRRMIKQEYYNKRRMIKQEYYNKRFMLICYNKT
jgi:hypothetical protein